MTFNPVRQACDRLIRVVDSGIRSTTGEKSDRMPTLEPVDDTKLSDVDRNRSAQLMRVNHTGEVCAQALYEGQAATARTQEVRLHLLNASVEEQDHLHWCRHRLTELDTRPSILNPLFYLASSAIGGVVGLFGDRINLGFVEATEDQVSEHLDRHLDALPIHDSRSRGILERIRIDEQRHRTQALDSGGSEFPRWLKGFMTIASRIMTSSTKYL